MQQLVRSIALLMVITGAVVLAGCEGGTPPDAPGVDAKSGKTYTAEDANKAQPVRGKTEDPEEKGR